MAKIASTDGEIYKKIQLCVCFPTDNTQQLSLIYKPDETAETSTIVTLTTDKQAISGKPWFNPLNEVYYILSKVQHSSGFSMADQAVTGIKENELSGLNIEGGKSLADLNTKISKLIATINENAKPKIDENDLETKGGYFDVGKPILFNIDNTIKNGTIQNIKDNDTIKIKIDNGNEVYDVRYSDIKFDDNLIKNTKYGFDISKISPPNNIVLFKEPGLQQFWHLGKYIQNNTEHNIEGFDLSTRLGSWNLGAFGTSSARSDCTWRNRNSSLTSSIGRNFPQDPNR